MTIHTWPFQYLLRHFIIRKFQRNEIDASFTITLEFARPLLLHFKGIWVFKHPIPRFQELIRSEDVYCDIGMAPSMRCLRRNPMLFSFIYHFLLPTLILSIHFLCSSTGSLLVAAICLLMIYVMFTCKSELLSLMLSSCCGDSFLLLSSSSLQKQQSYQHKPAESSCASAWRRCRLHRLCPTHAVYG